jgi:hypothetical protein
VISTLAARVQHRRNMATEPESVLCTGVSFDEICDNFRRECITKFEKDLPTANLNRGINVCEHRLQGSGRPSISAETN